MESSEKMEEHSSQFSLGFCGVGVAEMRCPDKISQFERLWCLHSTLARMSRSPPLPITDCCSLAERDLFTSPVVEEGGGCLLFHRDIFSGQNSKLELRVGNMDKTYKHMRCFLSCQPHH